MSRRHSLLASCLALVIAVTLAAPVAASQVRLRVSASPSSMTFGSVALDQESAPQVFYFTNRSTIPLRVVGAEYYYGPNSSFSWDIQISVSGMTASCFDLPGFILQPGQACGFEVVTFKPVVTGAHSLSIGTWFTDGVSVVEVWVTAKGRGI